MHRLLWLFSRVIVLIASSAIITMIHPVLLLIIATLLAFNFIITTRTKKLDKQANDALTKTQRKLQYMTNTMSDFSYGKDVRLFSMKNFLMPRYKDEQQHIFNGRMKIQQRWLRSKNVFAFTSLLQETVMYAWLCWQVLNGSISIGDFTMYIAAILKFSQAMRGILDDIAHIRQQHEVICDFRSFLDYPDLLYFTRLFDQHYTTLHDQIEDLYYRNRTHLPEEIRRKKEEALHSGQRAATLH